MKLVCPACERLVELEQFRLEGTSLVVTCGKCGAQSWVDPQAQGPAAPPAGEVPPPRPSPPPPRVVAFTESTDRPNVVTLRTTSVAAVEKAAEAAEHDPFTVPEGACPRCLARRGTQATSCPTCGVVFAQLAPGTLSPPVWLAEAWRELLKTWGDDARHERLRTRAFEQEELAALGRLYRIRLAWAPEDPWAQQGRDEVLRLATAPVSLGPPERDRTSLKYAVIGGLVFFTVVALLTLVRVVLKSLP